MSVTATQGRSLSFKELKALISLVIRSLFTSGATPTRPRPVQSESADQLPKVIPIREPQGNSSVETDTPKAGGDSLVGVDEQGEANLDEMESVMSASPSPSAEADQPIGPSVPVSEPTRAEPEIKPVAPPSVDATPIVDNGVAMWPRLFELLRSMQLGPNGFNIESALHQICVDPAELQRFCEVLAAPLLLKSTQPIAVVIGVGGCGSALAGAVARRLSPCTLHKNSSAVAFLPMEKNGKRSVFIAPDLAGKLLRGKQVLIVTPILTPANVAEIQGMIHAVESELNVNANVHSIVTLLELQNCGPLTHSVGKASSIKVWSGLTLNFGL
ncbi:MAG: hypothetical protein IPJ68_02595 [Candidatus Moraniibacteriota bacterium]|nr:MAG: hypothetical protein IPJ68_02595 [Candidatus Moranbacteria bacterium]